MTNNAKMLAAGAMAGLLLGVVLWRRRGRLTPPRPMAGKVQVTPPAQVGAGAGQPTEAALAARRKTLAPQALRLAPRPPATKSEGPGLWRPRGADVL